MADRALNPTEFGNLVTAITSAFGDPTRRDIYLLIHERQDGLTASEVAEATGLHANVARHHLDKLVGGSYVEVTQRQSSGAGRPAKVYKARDTGLELEFGVGQHDILVTLLGKALSRLGEAESAVLAEEVGLEFGKQMAASMGDAVDGQRSFRSALHVVADALSAHGFSAHAERHGEELRIVSGHCPFGDVAIEHPVICAVDRGMVKGLLGPLYGETEVALSSSVALGDDECIAEVHRPAAS
ncbi:MAG: helix-turn-helix domain-containing protein [Actinomycetota bacterium]